MVHQSGTFALVLAVVVVVATERDTPQRVCVSPKSDEGQQDSECIRCNSVTCIAQNTNDSTHIQFVSKTFELDNTLRISDREGIQLEGTAKDETRISCKKQSWEEVGLEFSNIQNLTIVNITVDNCGVWSQRTSFERYRFYSAIFLIRCTHVHISGVRILHSVGSGLAIIDTNGTVTVQESLFEKNGIRDVAEVVGAGGLHVQFTKCSINAWDSKCSSPNKWTNATFNFNDCNFTSNNASISESKALRVNERRLLGRGGGLGIILSDGAANNRITLTNCHFLNNTAAWGGGMHVWFRNSSHDNQLVVRDCHFENNYCPSRGGGAINVVSDNQFPKGNEVIFENIHFVENSAGFGGGIGIYSSPMSILFHKCSWMRNKANFSSALDITYWMLSASQTLPHGYHSQVLLSDSIFINNAVLHHKMKANSSEQVYQEGKGAMAVTAHSVQFEGNTTFIGNNGTALYLVTSTATFAPNSTVLFEGNCGLQGGAVALIGLSAIRVQQNSCFTFRNNRAYTSGGAIYYFSMDQHEYFRGSINCFIKGLGNKKNIKFIFDGNQAEEQHGKDIQATTLKQCRRMCNVRKSNDPVKIFECIGQFNFTDKTASVSTSGRWYSVNGSLPLVVIPGKEFQIPFEVRDDLNEVTKDYYNARVRNTNGSNIVVDPAYTLIANEHMKLYGEPGDKAKLLVTKVGARSITLALEVELSSCPPGFDLQNIKTSNKKLPGKMCTCSNDYDGIIQCNFTNYFASAKRGYWVGYEDKNVHTSHCPSGYCFYEQDLQSSGGHFVYDLPTEASQKELDMVVCGPNRTGVVCGKCTSNYSAYYHTYTFFCGSSDKCSVGWALYIVSELLPLTIIFFVVIYFNISFTSGAASGFIFFAQVIDSLSIQSQERIWLKQYAYHISDVYRFIYRFFNFDFFSNKQLSFCVIKGATSLDILAFKYVTVLYAFIMMFLLIVMFKYCNLPFSRKYSCKMKHTVQHSVIHGLSAFLIMCYTQCIRVSFLLLVPVAIHSRGGKKVRTVVFRNGEIDYFSMDHLPYALPAIVCLIFALFPPALLILYPLHYRIIAALRLDEKQCFLKVSKYISLERMKPLLDSFQSCFKDNCRCFAGLYFLYRFLLLLLFAVLQSYTMFYTVVEIQLIVILAVHTYIQPYQRQLYNAIDTLVFTNLAIINAITLLNYSMASRRGDYVKEIDTFSSIQLILVLLPLCILVGYGVYRAVQKVRSMIKREGSKTEGDMEKDAEELEMPARLIHEDESSNSDESTDYQHYEDTETNTSYNYHASH